MNTARLNILIRRNLPVPIRQAFRIGRHLIAGGTSSIQVPENLFSDCRMCASRYHLLEKLPRGGRVAEVGTYKGYFAKHILATAVPDELHLIDLDCSLIDASVTSDSHTRVHSGPSHQVLAQFPDAYFDWIYIDADHSYGAVLNDAEIASLKVKPNGFLVFNDFAHADPFLGTYGVHRAVTDFAVRHGWLFAWFAYEPNALYDVALQRLQDSKDR